MFQIDKRVITHFDFLIPLLILPIVISSYILIYESNPILASKQLVYFGIGIAIFCLFFLLPIKKLEWLIPILYFAGVLFLISVWIFGFEMLGAKRWINIPFVNFSVQPSEIFKPIFLLMICYLVKQTPPPANGYNLKQFAIFSAYILIPTLVIAKQPDLGTAILILTVGYGVLFIVGVNKKIWLALILVMPLVGFVHYNYFMHDYQKKRIEVFLGNPEAKDCGAACHQVRQSIVAIGSGGFFGKSKEEATQSRFRFLPVVTTDFIFPYLVERGGFFAGFIIIVLYAFLIFHLMTLYISNKGNYFTQAMTTGIAILLFMHMGVNIAMTIGLAPVVGIPLPFLSYGGSSFVTFMIFLGILENLLAFRFDPTHKYIRYLS